MRYTDTHDKSDDLIAQADDQPTPEELEELNAHHDSCDLRGLASAHVLDTVPDHSFGFGL